MRLAFEIQADNDEASDSEEEQLAFADRIAEFWDVVKMSFSSFEDDKYVTTYHSFAPPKVLNRNWLWCPIVGPTRVLVDWLEYSPRVREAIRLALRRGLGLQTDYNRFEKLEHWLEIKSSFQVSIPPFFNLIGEEAKRTRQYALARVRVEFILNAIYQHGKNVPYHPLFNRRFAEQLAAKELPEVEGFLGVTCLNYGLATAEGLSYLADLVSDSTHAPFFIRPDVAFRAQRWLQDALTSSIKSPSSFSKDRIKVKRHDIPASLPLLSPADLILVEPFSLDEAFRLAVKLKICDENGKYLLGPRKLGAVVGFCLALQKAGKLSGAIAELTAVIGPLVGVVLKTRKMTTDVSQRYERLTTKELDLPK